MQEQTERFNVSTSYKFELDDMYNSLLDRIDEQTHKLDEFLQVSKFWELVGYEEYHETAVVYDYVSFINDHHDGFPDHKFVRLNYNHRRLQALSDSIEIMNKTFYQSPSTDVKFVNLSPGVMDNQKADEDTNRSFESIICVSGFLSQRDNLKESWHAVLDKSDDDTPVIGYKWPAEDHLSIFNKILLEIVNIRFDNIGNITFGDVMAFNGVRAVAKESGKLLADALILEYPHYLPKVSFVSFSLGTEVVKS